MYPYMKMIDIIMSINQMYIGIKHKTEFFNAIVLHPDSFEHVGDIESLQLFGRPI